MNLLHVHGPKSMRLILIRSPLMKLQVYPQFRRGLMHFWITSELRQMVTEPNGPITNEELHPMEFIQLVDLPVRAEEYYLLTGNILLDDDDTMTIIRNGKIEYIQKT